MKTRDIRKLVVTLLISVVFLFSTTDPGVPGSKVSWNFHMAAEYRDCHSFTYHHLTGSFNRGWILGIEKLRQTLRNAGYRLIKDYQNPAGMPPNAVEYGDVLTIGEAHSGIVGFYDVPGQKELFCHFRGFTVWDAAGKVIDRSDRPNPRKQRSKPLDHGIYCHTPAGLAKFEAYEGKPVSQWRLNWVGTWKLVRVSIAMGETSVEMPPDPKAMIEINLKSASIDKGKAKLKIAKSSASDMPFPVEFNVDFATPRLVRGKTPEGLDAEMQMSNDKGIEGKILALQDGQVVTLGFGLAKQAN